MHFRDRTFHWLAGIAALVVSLVPLASSAVPADVTVLATQDATPTEDGGALGRNTYTSGTYGYEIAWNRDQWDASLPDTGGDGELLLLESAVGSLYIWAGDQYAGDPAACLQGEADYYATEDSAVSDWSPVTNDSGDPIGGDRSGISYGVYSLTYTEQDVGEAEGIELVDYLECRTLVPGQAVMFVLATSTPENYNEFVRDVFGVTGTIAFAEGAASGTPVASPEAETDTGGQATPAASPETSRGTPAATYGASPSPASPEPGTGQGEGDAGLTGTTYTSPGFGYGLEIPSGWTVDDVASEDGTDTLAITNGTSVITITGTSEYSGDLVGCVEYVAGLAAKDPAYEGLELDETGSGDPFRGSDEDEAYANYVYDNEAGDTYAHFINCRSIVEGESVLILEQDVPYEEYSTQRQARILIQQGITLP